MSVQSRDGKMSVIITSVPPIVTLSVTHRRSPMVSFAGSNETIVLKGFVPGMYSVYRYNDTISMLSMKVPYTTDVKGRLIKDLYLNSKGMFFYVSMDPLDDSVKRRIIKDVGEMKQNNEISFQNVYVFEVESAFNDLIRGIYVDDMTHRTFIEATSDRVIINGCKE